MVNLEILGSIATQLHQEFKTLFYVLLPVFFALSLVFAWFRNPAGGPDFIDSLKRVVIASLLMAAFQEIADTILAVTNGLATKIGDMQALDTYMKMVAEKASSYPSSPMAVVLAVDDFFMAILSYGSYLLLYFARSLMMAVYQFTWMFLIILSPILLLFHVFTSKITMNLFKSLIEVASWQIVWAVLAVMLKALPFGSWVVAEEGYLTLILLNFIIAVSLFLTPFLVKAIVGGSFSAVAGSLMPLTATAILAAPAKAAKAVSIAALGREAIADTAGFMRSRVTHRLGQGKSGASGPEIRQAVEEHGTRDGGKIQRPPSVTDAPRPSSVPFENEDKKQT